MNNNINQGATPAPAEGIGRLIFRITTASGAIPLEGAQVTLRSVGPEGDTNRGTALAVLISDRSGKTQVIELPAPARSLSMAPSPDGAPAPFSCYDADITLNGYYTLNYVCIPVFDGITSIQPADLTPLPENGREDGVTPEDTMIVEGENPDL